MLCTFASALSLSFVKSCHIAALPSIYVTATSSSCGISKKPISRCVPKRAISMYLYVSTIIQTESTRCFGGGQVILVIVQSSPFSLSVISPIFGDCCFLCASTATNFAFIVGKLLASMSKSSILWLYNVCADKSIHRMRSDFIFIPIIIFQSLFFLCEQLSACALRYNTHPRHIFPYQIVLLLNR